MTIQVDLTGNDQFPSTYKVSVPKSRGGTVVSISYRATTWGGGPTAVTAQFSPDGTAANAIDLTRPDPAASADDPLTANRVSDTFHAEGDTQYRLPGGGLFFDVSAYSGSVGLKAIIIGAHTEPL